MNQKDSLSKFYIEGSPVNFYGRNDFSNAVTMYNGASGFETKFVGSTLKAVMAGYYGSYYGSGKSK